MRLDRILLAFGLLCWVAPVVAHASVASKRPQPVTQAGCPHAHAKAQVAQRKVWTVIIREPADGSIPLFGHSAFAP